jgi:hypothetical protein
VVSFTPGEKASDTPFDRRLVGPQSWFGSGGGEKNSQPPLGTEKCFKQTSLVIMRSVFCAKYQLLCNEQFWSVSYIEHTRVRTKFFKLTNFHQILFSSFGEET